MSLNDSNYSEQDYGEDVAEASNKPSPVEIAGGVAPMSAFFAHDEARENIYAGGNSELGGDYEDARRNIYAGGSSELGGDYEDARRNIYAGGSSELGLSPWDVFAAEPVVVGEEAVKRVIEKARDNRRPAPRMEAVSPDAPVRAELLDDWGLTDVFLGAAEKTGEPDPFPKTSAHMLRFGGGGEPRFVRVDTEKSYKKFRADSSPEMAELRARVEELTARLAAHESDPNAHARVFEELEEVTSLGEAALSAEKAKRVDLWLPKRFEGKWAAWIEGDFVCVSVALPDWNNEVRICTSLEPLKKCVAEMARHASEAGVPASSVVSVIPAMGAVLGAGTAMKEIAAAATSILKRPEARVDAPFFVRLEPKANPAICALVALLQECRAGDAAACDEWKRLSESGPVPVKQAMSEAFRLASGRGKAA